MIPVADVMTIVATAIQECLYASGGYDGLPDHIKAVMEEVHHVMS